MKFSLEMCGSVEVKSDTTERKMGLNCLLPFIVKVKDLMH